MIQIIQENLQSLIIFVSGILLTFIIARIVHNFLAKHTYKKILEEPKLKTTYLFIGSVAVAAITLLGLVSTHLV